MPGDRGGERLRQDPAGASPREPPAGEGACRGLGAPCGPRAVRPLRCRLGVGSGTGDRLCLPGARLRFRSGRPSRSPDRGGGAAASGGQRPRRARGRSGAPGGSGVPGSGPRPGGVSAPPLRRAPATRIPRHGAGGRPEDPDRRRADDRPRRDGGRPGDGAVGKAAPRSRPDAASHHPRPRPGRAARRPRPRPLRGPVGRRVRSGSALQPAAAPLHAGPARFGAAHSRGRSGKHGGPVSGDTGSGARSARPAAACRALRAPLPGSLQPCDRAVPPLYARQAAG